jgi:hypothetical protein
VRILQGILNPLSVLLENDHLLCEPLRHVEDAGLPSRGTPRTLEVGYRRVARRPQT